MFSFLNSYRNQLILILSVTLVLIFCYGFYIYSTAIGLETVTHEKSTITNSDIDILEKGIHDMANASFGFIAITFAIISSSLLYVVITLNYFLGQLLRGLKEIDSGKLDYKIPLEAKNEFGTIAQFLNNAMVHLSFTQKQLIDSKASIENEVTVRTKELQAERNKLSVIVAGITDSVIALDLDRNVVLFNKNAEELTGFKSDQVLGKNISQVIEFFENNSSVTLQAFAPKKAKGYEGIVFMKDNIKLVSARYIESWVRLTVSQILEGDDVNLGNILTIHDRTREQELEEMKIDFVSMAAHELRTPLTSIKGYLSVFINENKGKFADDQKMLLNRIAISSDQLSGLVENILSVSRIERGGYTINTEPMDWVVFVDSIVNQFKLRAQEKSITIQFIQPTEMIPNVRADKLRIVEVLNNLIANAISYTPEGGSVTVWTEQLDNKVITHVKDTGRGISKEALPHLFTKFFRVAGKLSGGSKGTGLGLYISKAIVELHGGTVWVESQTNIGSIFSFSLPIMED